MYAWLVFPPSLWLAFSFALRCLLKNKRFKNWWHPFIFFFFFFNNSWFLCPTCEAFAYPKVGEIFPCVFFLKFYSVSFYVEICDSLSVNFCVWYNVKVKVHFSLMAVPLCHHQMFKRLSCPQWVMCPFIKMQLFIYTWVCF